MLCLIAIAIGVLAGIFSWLFRFLIGFIHNAVFLGQLAPQYDANVHTPGSYLGWLIIFAPVVGGLVVVFLIRNFAPEAKGHGVPEVMSAIYHKRGLIPGSVSIVKALASAITIGTGGSLGREGPIIQISAALSSSIGKLARVSVSQRNLLIACGASSGIAATFNAPLGGILFSIELLLVSINSRTILPVAIAAVIAANVGHYLIGNEPAFSIPQLFGADTGSTPYISLLAVPLGGLIGLFSLIFIHSIYFSEDLFEKLPVNPYVRHMIGTLLLGIMFYAIYLQFGHYYVQGVGYATIQDTLMNAITHPGFLLFLLIAKTVATNLTIGSGGSGGVFSPSLFLGAVIGAFFGNMVTLLFPDLGINPVVFVVSGMAAMVSGTTSAPLTAAIIVYEMTRDYNAILPIPSANENSAS
jgi:CIC family chloride channel protein